jgi:hypothetical protein
MILATSTYPARGKGVGMLRMAMVMAVLASSSAAYALNNSDLLQLNLSMSQQQRELEQGLRQFDMAEQVAGPLDQARLQRQDYLREQIGRRQQEQIRQEQYRQETLWEWQRRRDARRYGEDRLRDVLMERERSGVFK